MKKMVFGACALLVGCGGITPMSGDYDLTVTLDANTCGEMADGDVGDTDDSTASFVFNEDGSVTIDGEADSPFDCALDGATMTCVVEEEEIGSGVEDGLDFSVTMDISVSMVWDSNTTATGDQAQTLNCAGADCEMVNEFYDEEFGATLPCSTTMSIVATYVDDEAAAE